MTGSAPTTQTKANIDLDQVGQIDGKDVYDVDLESFEDKPWRKPGADITISRFDVIKKASLKENTLSNEFK
jgi:hypothetical protein